MLFVYFVQFGDVMENNVNKKASAARIKANAKYNAKTYKQLNANVRIEDYNMIDTFCKNNNISKASLIVTACKRYIEDYVTGDND